ncbi:MAG: DUF4252 domain-containing protein [Bryobacteraceae bacterium]|nr:DUF4252 domain-containing protein [Bryobacteraceae bacterium]
MMRFLPILMAAAAAAFAQAPTLPPEIERLSKDARETVTVTMDAKLLQFAAAFLSERNPEEARVKKMVAGLKNVVVRSFEFDRDQTYGAAELNALRSQYSTGGGWQKAVEVRSKLGENTDVYFRPQGQELNGLAVVVAEPRELTVVYVEGAIKPEEVADLGGHFGLPRFGRRSWR